MVKISLNLGCQLKMFGPLIQKIVLDIVNWNENKVIIVLNIMNWNEKRVQILWVQELEWKQGKIFQRKRTGEPWNENVDPSRFYNCTEIAHCWFWLISVRFRARTTDTQWRHKLKTSEKLGWCGRQNMLRPYLKIWDWDWIFGRAVKAIFSLSVRSPWPGRWRQRRKIA